MEDQIIGYVATLLKPLLSYPEQLVVAKVEDVEEPEPYTLYLSIKVNDRDISTVIGKQGATIMAARRLTIVLGRHFRTAVRLAIVEKTGQISFYDQKTQEERQTA